MVIFPLFEEAWRALTTGVTIWIVITALITVFTIINNLITLMGRCEGTLTVPAAHFSFHITLHWRGIEGGVPHGTPQVFQGKTAAPMRTFVALYRLTTRGATSLGATHC